MEEVINQNRRPTCCGECKRFNPNSNGGYCKYLNYKTKKESQPCSAGWKDVKKDPDV